MRAWSIFASSTLAILGASSCGYITIGHDFGPVPDAATPDEDVGVVDPPDMGFPDNGVEPADAGGEDREMPVDGGGCPTPEFPVDWPFAHTFVAYKAEFYDAIPNRASCSIGSCHGGAFEPTIPANVDDLLVPANLDAAISSIWMRTIPMMQTDGTTDSTLHWWHGVANMAPMFTADTNEWILGFVARAEACKWVGVDPLCVPQGTDITYCAPR